MCYPEEKCRVRSWTSTHHEQDFELLPSRSRPTVRKIAGRKHAGFGSSLFIQAITRLRFCLNERERAARALHEHRLLGRVARQDGKRPLGVRKQQLLKRTTSKNTFILKADACLYIPPKIPSVVYDYLSTARYVLHGLHGSRVRAKLSCSGCKPVQPVESVPRSQLSRRPGHGRRRSLQSWQTGSLPTDYVQLADWMHKRPAWECACSWIANFVFRAQGSTWASKAEFY